MEIAKTEKKVYKVSENALKRIKEMDQQANLAKQAFELFIRAVASQLEMPDNVNFKLNYDTGIFEEVKKQEPEKK